MAPQCPQVVIIAVNVESGRESLVEPMAPDTVLIQQPQNHSLGRIRVNIQQPAVKFIPG